MRFTDSSMTRTSEPIAAQTFSKFLLLTCWRSKGWRCALIVLSWNKFPLSFIDGFRQTTWFNVVLCKPRAQLAFSSHVFCLKFLRCHFRRRGNIITLICLCNTRDQILNLSNFTKFFTQLFFCEKKHCSIFLFLNYVQVHTCLFTIFSTANLLNFPYQLFRTATKTKFVRNVAVLDIHSCVTRVLSQGLQTWLIGWRGPLATVQRPISQHSEKS